MTAILLTHTPAMRAGYYGERALAALRDLGEVRLHEGEAPLDGDALVTAAQGCAIVVSDRQTPAPAAVFERSPDLVAFLRCAVDIRNVDVEAASRNGVLVVRATPGFGHSVAEMALGFMIDLARHITLSSAEYRAGGEARPRLGHQLKGSTLGLIGYGLIAETLAPVALALGMRVLAADPFKAIIDPGIEQVGQDALLERSDFVICLAAATDATENLMSADAFARMKPGSYFLNLSRGDLVDEAALEAALDSGWLAGAALDVGRAPDQKPSLRLARRPDVIATPHTAGLTEPAIEHQAFDTVRQVRALLAGELPPEAVNPDSATRFGRWRA
jgi:D-3-phosphoglycerate dehydrogenase